MTEPRVEAGDRALEVLAEIMEMAPIRHTLGLNHTYESGCRCLRCAADSAIETALIQSAMNAQERELREALKTLYVLARVTVSGHKSGREHHPELHLCESCNSNVADLCEGIAEAERLLTERGEGR